MRRLFALLLLAAPALAQDPVARPPEPRSLTTSVSPAWYRYAVYLEQLLQAAPPPPAELGRDAIALSLERIERLVTERRVGLPRTASVTLQWIDNATNETAYIVERRAGTGAWAQAATLGANVTHWTDRDLPAGALAYRVFARNAAGDSASTNILAVLVSYNISP